MSELRCIRIGELLKEKISDFIMRNLRDQIGFTTITDVKVTPDMRNATVYYSVLGSEEDKNRTATGLDSARGEINRRIGREIQIKYTPVIRFEYDDTTERASRVFELLNKIEEEKVEHTETIPKKTRRNKKGSRKSKK